MIDDDVLPSPLLLSLLASPSSSLTLPGEDVLLFLL